MARHKRRNPNPRRQNPPDPGPPNLQPDARTQRRLRSPLLWAGLVIAATVSAVAAWWWLRPGGMPGREQGLSVLLITVDTLRADSLGAYGSRTASTPHLDRLASAGVRFELAYAQNVVTLPSHANIFSGRYPTQHGVRDNSGFVFPSKEETLATLLKSQGYRTGAFVSAFPLATRFGLNRGFDVYDDSFVDATARPTFFLQERPGPDTVARALQWLAAEPGRPYFCWVHVYEPHFPYQPPDPFASRFRDRPYDGEVAATDAALGPLIEPLLNAGRNGRTVVVFTADHGESLGQHGEATHGVFAYESVLRVPLILYQPRLWRPHVVRGPARHVDLLPTILDALSLPIPSSVAGRSLLTDVAPGVKRARPGADDPEDSTHRNSEGSFHSNSESSSHRDSTGAERSTAQQQRWDGPSGPYASSYFEALSASLNRGWAPLYGVVDRGLKYIDLPVPELYDLGRDPDETNNLAKSRPDEMRRLQAVLARFRANDVSATRTAVTADTRERLRSLGYVTSVGVPAAATYTEADDPKRLITLDSILQDVEALALSGDLGGAVSRCLELIERRPGMAVSYLHLAHLERERGNLEEGVRALKQAIALTPDDQETASLLGAYLTEAGRPGEAVRLLEPFARRNPPDVPVLVSFALALARTGRFADALGELGRARNREPGNAMLLVHEGTIELMAGDRERARRSFAAALAANPGVARAHSSLAFLDAEDGRDDEAIEHWRRAVASDQREYGKLVGLAALLVQRGQTDRARRYLEFFVAGAPAQYAAEIERARSWLSRPR